VLLLQNQGKYEDARLSFKAILDREEKDAPAQLAIARSYFAEKKYDEAITEGEKALQFIRDRYKKEEVTGDKTGDQSTNPAPAPGAAGSAEDPLAATTQTAAAAASAATTQTATASPATTGTLAANAATSPTAAAIAGTTQTAVAAAPTTPTLASEPATL
jgi:tetratricopeptide (TPR) repeat protein